MNENWLEIVSTLRSHFENDSTEDVYQREIETCLQMLGWKRYNRSMLSQHTLPIGNNNNIRLDILLRKEEVNVLPIEVKRPSNVCSERQELQLMSYMRQLRVNVGLYIGEKIRLFYDNPNDDKNAVCVFSVRIDGNDANGEKLCELLDYATFDKDVFEAFCEEEYNKMQTRSSLHQQFSEYFSTEHGVNNIQSLIKEKFIAEGYEDLAIDEMLKSLRLSVAYIPGEYSAEMLEEQQSRHSVSDNVHFSNFGTSSQMRERKAYTRTSPVSVLRITFADGTIFEGSNAIDVERLFIIKVGVERVRGVGLTHCHEDLIGKPETTRNPEKYKGRWKAIEKGWYLFTCTSNGDKKKHINKIIQTLGIDAKVELLFEQE